MKKLNLHYFLILAVSFFISSCGNDDDNMNPESKEDGVFMLHFQNMFGEEQIALDKEFTTPEGEKITFSRYEYILSNFVLTKEDGSTYEVPDSYYFMGIGQANPELREMISLANIPAGKYTALSFSVGVDDATNTSIDAYEKGELSANVGMNWSWNTGYKFINWEGTFEHNSNGETPFYLHIGTNDNYRQISKTFDTPLEINGSKETMAHFMVMPEKIFTGLIINDLELLEHNGATFSAVMINPAETATQIANSYSQMFMLHHAENSDME